MPIFVKQTYISSGNQILIPITLKGNVAAQQDILTIQNNNANAIIVFAQTAGLNGNILLKDSTGTLKTSISGGGFSYMNLTNGLALGTATENAKSILTLAATTRGFLPPRMTAAQKNAIGNEAGLILYDTDAGKLCINTGAAWETVTSV